MVLTIDWQLNCKTKEYFLMPLTFCPRCGSSNTENKSVCSVCGFSLLVEGEAAPQPVYQQSAASQPPAYPQQPDQNPSYPVYPQPVQDMSQPNANQQPYGQPGPQQAYGQPYAQQPPYGVQGGYAQQPYGQPYGQYPPYPQPVKGKSGTAKIIIPIVAVVVIAAIALTLFIANRDPKYIRTLKSGRIAVEYRVIAQNDDEEYEFTVFFAYDGYTGEEAYRETFDDGVEYWLIWTSEAIWMLNEENKIFAEMSPEEEEELRHTEEPEPDGEVSDDYFKKVGSGEEEFNGETRKYIDYKTGNETTRYYFEGREIYGWQEDIKYMDGTTTTYSFIVTKLYDSIPADAFEIPDDYMEVTLDELIELVY